MTTDFAGALIRLKFVVYVSTISAHGFDQPGIIARPTYALTKLSATLAFQLIAAHASPKQLQIVSYHPGLIYNDEWASIGIPPQDFDKGEYHPVPRCKYYSVLT